MPREAKGTLQKLPGGRWQIVLSLTDGSRKRLPPLPVGTSEAMAKEKAAECARRVKELGIASPYREKAQQAKAAQQAVATTECGKWFETWLADRQARGLTSCRDDRGKWRLHLADALGSKHPKNWTRDDFRELSVSLDAKVQACAISWKTAVNLWGLATKMADDACNAKKTAIRCRDDNPSEGVRGPDRGAKTARQYLYPSEVSRFLECDEVPLVWRRLVAVAIYTYTRAGELRALTWDDVDLDRGVLGITKSIERETGILKSTKSKTPRLIPIEPSLLPLLRAMHNETAGEGPVVTLPTIKHLSRDFRRYLGISGIERKGLFDKAPSVNPIRFHDTRSTGVTWLAVRGDEPLRIQQRAGHTDFNTTQGYIREAEVLRAGFGEPFPVLPESLLGTNRSDETIGQSQGIEKIAFLVEAPGIEPGSVRRPLNLRSRA